VQALIDACSCDDGPTIVSISELFESVFGDAESVGKAQWLSLVKGSLELLLGLFPAGSTPSSVKPSDSPRLFVRGWINLPATARVLQQGGGAKWTPAVGPAVRNGNAATSKPTMQQTLVNVQQALADMQRGCDGQQAQRCAAELEAVVRLLEGENKMLRDQLAGDSESVTSMHMRLSERSDAVYSLQQGYLGVNDSHAKVEKEVAAAHNALQALEQEGCDLQDLVKRKLADANDLEARLREAKVAPVISDDTEAIRNANQATQATLRREIDSLTQQKQQWMAEIQQLQSRQQGRVS